jgi:hypothetical protein
MSLIISFEVQMLYNQAKKFSLKFIEKVYRRTMLKNPGKYGDGD